MPTAKRPRSSRSSRVRRPPRAGGRRAARKEALRSRIVTAALELFQSKGFDATTTRQIARRARVAEGTIFNYFETKEDIALHFFELEVDHAIATVRGNRALARAPLNEKLFAMVQSQLEFLAPYERFIGAAFVHALRPSSKLGFSAQALALRNRYLAFVQDLIDDSLDGRSGTALVMVAPLAFWILYVGLLLYWLNDTSPGKEQTLALLDRSLTIGTAMLEKGVIR
jgi:AcrR family transcriptional regulator